jgi:hypothetical protein
MLHLPALCGFSSEQQSNSMKNQYLAASGFHNMHGAQTTAVYHGIPQTTCKQQYELEAVADVCVPAMFI